MLASRTLETKLGWRTGVKVFSATKSLERVALGDEVTAWLAGHRDYELYETIVTQSSDSAFHCLSITLFFRYVSSAADRPGAIELEGDGSALEDGSVDAASTARCVERGVRLRLT